MLLVGSGLLLASFLNCSARRRDSTRRGSPPRSSACPATAIATPAQQADSSREVIDQLRAQPGVTDAAVAIGLPLSGFNPRSPYSVGGQQILPLSQRPLAGLAIVSDDYFGAMRISLVAGRAFTAADRDGAPRVCIINESLARRLFPGESALGRVLLRGRTPRSAARSSASSATSRRSG